MKQSERKVAKTSFLSGLRGLNWITGKLKRKFFAAFHVLSNCQVSEKSDERALLEDISGWTDRSMDVIP